MFISQTIFEGLLIVFVTLELEISKTFTVNLQTQYHVFSIYFASANAHNYHINYRIKTEEYFDQV